MKRKLTMLVVIMSLFMTTLNGQDRSAWYLGAGWHYVDYFAPIGGGWLETGNWNGDVIPLQFYLGRSLSNRMELGTSFSLLKLDKYPESLVKDNFFDWDVMLQYRFLGDRVAKGHWLDPYVWLGMGINNANDMTNGIMNVGGGVDFWVTKFAAINIHTGIDAMMGRGKHYTQHGFGLKFLVKSCDKGKAPVQVDQSITAEQRKEIDDQIRFSAKNINFETGSDVIRQDSHDDLDNIVNIMNRFPNTIFDIHGHTDNTGGAALNLDLSKRRAASVEKYFVDKGIDTARLFPEGFGESRPIAPNDTQEGRAQNRRVEIKMRSM